MKKGVFLTVFLIAASAVLLVTASLYAAATIPDVIKMENKAYSKHTKPAVSFAHKKHSEDYAKKFPEFYKSGCGECHHDQNNKPLTNLKAGDPVKNCIECHKKPGEKPKGKDAPKLTQKEELEYHAEALHDNCTGCHKEYNKKYKLKSKDPTYAPIACTKCHEK